MAASVSYDGTRYSVLDRNTDTSVYAFLAAVGAQDAKNLAIPICSTVQPICDWDGAELDDYSGADMFSIGTGAGRDIAGTLYYLFDLQFRPTFLTSLPIEAEIAYFWTEGDDDPLSGAFANNYFAYSDVFVGSVASSAVVPSSVPLPAPALLLVSGLGIAGALRRRRKT